MNLEATPGRPIMLGDVSLWKRAMTPRQILKLSAFPLVRRTGQILLEPASRGLTGSEAFAGLAAPALVLLPVLSVWSLGKRPTLPVAAIITSQV